MKAIVTLAVTCGLAANGAWAMAFGTWTEQRFALTSGNTWTQSEHGVEVVSDNSVSLIWTRLPRSFADATAASWTWSVETSVPATRLTQRGGDDRNLALYFLFMPPAVAQANRAAGVRKLLGIREARVLMYVWGGDQMRGDILPSPYLGTRGRTIVRRPAGTGTFVESVDLAEDFARAFGEAKPALVGLAVSSDSDDTGTQVRARLDGLRLD